MSLKRRMRVVGGDDDERDLNENGIRVAFASSDMEHVNQHFGFATSLVIYLINPEAAVLKEVVGFSYPSHDDSEGKLGEKLEVLKGCVAVYSEAVGSSAAQKLLNVGVQPVKVHDGAEISELIKYLQEEMLQGPSAWLAKAIQRQKSPDPSNYNDFEFESWDE
ncbi:MAG: NifB/NifX family molybdenum-iron cluster-binding protein [Gammaproteobacteria bacterium]|nr:NifB/NifX family molybdenum-iron cluster-binding protein [Gammaproteobacteria bacterium]